MWRLHLKKTKPKMGINPLLILDCTKKSNMKTSCFYKVILITLKNLHQSFPSRSILYLTCGWLLKTHIQMCMAYWSTFTITCKLEIILSLKTDLNPDMPACGFWLRSHFPLHLQRAGDAGWKVLKSFLTDYSQYYSVDSFYTDFFGYNGTWNWHGFLVSPHLCVGES